MLFHCLSCHGQRRAHQDPLPDLFAALRQNGFFPRTVATHQTEQQNKGQCFHQAESFPVGKLIHTKLVTRRLLSIYSGPVPVRSTLRRSASLSFRELGTPTSQLA